MLLSTHFTRLNPPYNNFNHALPDLDRIKTALPCFQLTLPDLTHLTTTFTYFSHALPDLDRITTALACFQLTLPDLTHLTTTLTYFSHALPNLGFGIDNDAFFSYIHDPYFEIKYEFGVIR
jgi:hypothetical protein